MAGSTTRRRVERDSVVSVGKITLIAHSVQSEAVFLAGSCIVIYIYVLYVCLFKLDYI